MRMISCSCSSRGALAGGSTAAATPPTISKAWFAGENSAPKRQTAPATSTTSTRLAMTAR